MRTYRVGRHQTNDIIVRHASVSRYHGEITCTDDGRYYLADLDSTNGTYVDHDGRWAQIDQAYVGLDDPVMLGEFITRLDELVGGDHADEVLLGGVLNPGEAGGQSRGDAPPRNGSGDHGSGDHGAGHEDHDAAAPHPRAGFPETDRRPGRDGDRVFQTAPPPEPAPEPHPEPHPEPALPAASHETIGDAQPPDANHEPANPPEMQEAEIPPPGRAVVHGTLGEGGLGDRGPDMSPEMGPGEIPPHEMRGRARESGQASARGSARGSARALSGHVADESGLKPVLWGALAILAIGFVALAGWVGYRYFTGETPQATARKANQSTTPKPVLTWSRSFGGDREDSGRSVAQTRDGGYIVAGQSASLGPLQGGAGQAGGTAGGQAGKTGGGLQGWLVRLDARGAPLWDRRFGGARADRLNFVTETSDGGFIAAGETLRQGKKKFDLWVIKVDAQGGVRWEKFFGGKRWDAGLAVAMTSDGGYVIAGTTESKGKGRRDVWAIKLDGNGETLWENTLGGRRDDTLAGGFLVTSDGGFIGAGWTSSRGKGRRDLWVFKLDAAGKPVWDRTYGGKGNDAAAAIRQTADDGFVVAGYTESKGAGKRDIWVLKLDASGKQIWDRTFGSAGRDDTADIVVTADNGFLVAGLTSGGDPDGQKTWLLRLDPQGEQIWDRRYPAENHGLVRAAGLTRDGGFILTGATAGGAARDGQLWVMKTNKSGELTN